MTFADAGTRHDLYTPALFQLRGRIGRVRYLAYNLALNLLAMVGVLLLETLRDGSALVDGLALGFVVVLLALAMVLAARRLHDLDRGGWLAAGLLVPMVNLCLGLYLLCARGKRDGNRFGPAPAPNPRGLVLLAWTFPALLLAGLLAAYALAPEESAAERARSGMEQAA